MRDKQTQDKFDYHQMTQDSTMIQNLNKAFENRISVHFATAKHSIGQSNQENH